MVAQVVCSFKSVTLQRFEGLPVKKLLMEIVWYIPKGILGWKIAAINVDTETIRRDEGEKKWRSTPKELALF